MNYPENIHQFNSHPRSPLYDDSRDEAMNARIEEIAEEMISEDGFIHNGAKYDLGDVTEHIYGADDDGSFHIVLASLVKDKTEASQLFMRSLLMKHARVIAEEIAEAEAG